MANIPVGINPLSAKPREVVAVFYVDGKEYERVVNHIEEFAIPHVVGAAYTQVEDPDIEGAADNARANGDPLPKGW